MGQWYPTLAQKARKDGAPGTHSFNTGKKSVENWATRLCHSDRRRNLLFAVTRQNSRFLTGLGARFGMTSVELIGRRCEGHAGEFAAEVGGVALADSGW